MNPSAEPIRPRSRPMIFFRCRSRLQGLSRWRPALVLCFFAGVAAVLLALLLGSPRAQPVQAAVSNANPDAICATCHAAIYDSYQHTAMARGSGPALDALRTGSYTDAVSGVTYRVLQHDDKAWMAYTRPANAPQGGLSGEHELQYFIGSGHRGRTYLYRQGKLWFELPINYYTRRNALDMAPNYSGSTGLPAPLPVDAACLHCHVTGVAADDGTARNALPEPPFAQSGVGCSSCHGDPSQHLASGGHAAIMNPAKLDAERRDSACIQCHLEGDAAVFRAGRSPAQFRPGDRLNDIAVYFVRASQSSGGSRATSQYEAMMQSACKRGSGDRLTCTTCHDPHSSPAPAARAAFYRARCIACHSTPHIATQHHPEQQDCAMCHMPSRSTSDISHEQVTDHNIQRTPASQKKAQGGELVPVAGFTAGTRELGLAYAQIALRGDEAAGRRALQLLTDAQGHGANDPQVLLRLGFLYQVSGQLQQARSAYQQVLKANPNEPAALSNLAVLQAGSGHVPEALALLQHLVADDPSQTTAGLNLALLQCRTGDAAGARATVARLQPFNPDAPAIHAFQQRGCASR